MAEEYNKASMHVHKRATLITARIGAACLAQLGAVGGAPALSADPQRSVNPLAKFLAAHCRHCDGQVRYRERASLNVSKLLLVSFPALCTHLRTTNIHLSL